MSESVEELKQKIEELEQEIQESHAAKVNRNRPITPKDVAQTGDFETPDQARARNATFEEEDEYEEDFEDDLNEKGKNQKEKSAQPLNETSAENSHDAFSEFSENSSSEKSENETSKDFSNSSASSATFSKENFENDFYNKTKKNAKQKKGGVIFLVVVSIFAILALCAGFFFSFQRKNISAKKSAIAFAQKNRGGININFRDFPFATSHIKSPYVARLYIRGIIEAENQNYNQKWLLQTIENLKNDSENLGILLVVDSPGGTVYEADEAYLALKEYKDSGKEIWAYFQSVAASGAYYISCSANKIWANRNTTTGSIGVISGPYIDATGLLEKIGLKAFTFASGKNKGMLDYNSPITDEQKKIMQSVCDECYEQFAQIVSSERAIPLEELFLIADGRIYTARQAKENGLVDEIGMLKEAEENFVQKIVSESEDLQESDIDFCDFEYECHPSFFEWFLNGVQTIFAPKTLFDENFRFAPKALLLDFAQIEKSGFAKS